jgi:hypothetical protein
MGLSVASHASAGASPRLTSLPCTCAGGRRDDTLFLAESEPAVDIAISDSYPPEYEG